MTCIRDRRLTLHLSRKLDPEVDRSLNELEAIAYPRRCRDLPLAHRHQEVALSRVKTELTVLLVKVNPLLEPPRYSVVGGSFFSVGATMLVNRMIRKVHRAILGS